MNSSHLKKPRARKKAPPTVLDQVVTAVAALLVGAFLEQIFDVL